MIQKKLQPSSEYNQYDMDGDGVVDDEELAAVKEIKEFNIGHFIIGESIFYGLGKVIKRFKNILK